MSLVTAVALVALVGLLALSYARFQPPRDAATASVVPPTLAGGPVSLRCIPERAPLPSILSSDPCADGLDAVRVAVADVGFAIERVDLEAGPFYCGLVFPNGGSPNPCSQPYMFPLGQFMHAWATFTGTDKVAAVMLGLDLPERLDEPGATRPPWVTTLVAFEIPPDGWVMP